MRVRPQRRRGAGAGSAAYAPDVVTLDVHMPQMDGLDCLDRIMIERPCPVVMVSSLTADGAEATLEALRLGAVDFIAKPAGAVSLGIQDMASELVGKVRAAAGARLRASLRLKERVRHRMSAGAPVGPRSTKASRTRAPDPQVTRAPARRRPRQSATGWFWSARPPAVRPRWRRC